MDDNDRWFTGDHKETTLEHILLDVKQHTNNSGKIYVGSDSFVHKKNCVFCCVIVLHGAENQSGGRYYYRKYNSKRADYPTMVQRLTEEVSKSIQIGMAIGEHIPNVKLEIHLDINSDRRQTSSKLLESMTGWVKAIGFECKVKPYAWASSTIADIHTK
jgi:predicted RNase H-related nuclease YkuK (DUF458 family)